MACMPTMPSQVPLSVLVMPVVCAQAGMATNPSAVPSSQHRFASFHIDLMVCFVEQEADHHKFLPAGRAAVAKQPVSVDVHRACQARHPPARAEQTA